MWKAERGSKTRQGDGHCRAFNPKAYATENEHCPVRLYLKFASHRPEEMKRPEAPFFLAINHKRKPADPVWYSRAPLGKKQDRRIFDEGCEEFRTAWKCNQLFCAKTCFSRLMNAEVPVNYVAQLSGHKNLKSSYSYKTASDDHQRKMSLLLSSETKSSKLLQARIPSLVFLLARTSVKLKAALHVQFLFQYSTLQQWPGESSARSKPRKRHIIISDDSDSD